MWTSSIFVLCAVWRIQHVMGCIILFYVEQSSESCEWEFRCAAPPDSQAESTTAVTAPKNTHRYTDSLVRKGFVNIWSCAFAVMSLLWKRAGRLRVDSRVCCMTPSRSQRPVWRYDAAAAVAYCCFPWIICGDTLLKRKRHPLIALDVEWVDVAAWRPEFFQRPLLNWVPVPLLPPRGFVV